MYCLSGEGKCNMHFFNYFMQSNVLSSKITVLPSLSLLLPPSKEPALSNNNTFASPSVHLSFNRIAIKCNNSLFQFSPLYHYKLPTERISNELSNFFQLITRYSLKHNFPPPKNLLSSNMKGDKTGRERGEKRIHEDFAWKVTRAWGMKKGRYRGDIFLEWSRAKTAAVPE